MKRLNKAFTLTELLVALGVIGILCAILLPVIFNIIPNQNTIMAKRAYYTTQTVVADLINNGACYPDKTLAAGDEMRIGFDDGFGTPNCILWGGDEETGTIETEGNADQKFVKLFLDSLGLSLADLDSQKYFRTNDGIEWGIIGGISDNFKRGEMTIMVDVNGDKKPNCGESAPTQESLYATPQGDCTGRTKGFDRFGMTIKADGKIIVIDDWAKHAVSVNKDITEE